MNLVTGAVVAEVVQDYASYKCGNNLGWTKLEQLGLDKLFERFKGGTQTREDLEWLFVNHQVLGFVARAVAEQDV